MSSPPIKRRCLDKHRRTCGHQSTLFQYCKNKPNDSGKPRNPSDSSYLRKPNDSRKPSDSKKPRDSRKLSYSRKSSDLKKPSDLSDSEKPSYSGKPSDLRKPSDSEKLTESVNFELLEEENSIEEEVEEYFSQVSDSSSSVDIDGAGGLWSGCSLQDIAHGPSPDLPRLAPSSDHAVLFRIPLQHSCLPKPYPEKFQDVWDSSHVKMPCSSNCLYPVQQASNQSLLPRWDLIRQSLEKPIVDSYQLEKAIMTYNSVYSKKWKFGGLHAYFKQCRAEESSHFFSRVLPAVITTALQLPKLVTHSVPLLKRQKRFKLSLSQQQVMCLLANAFLCTFPRRNSSFSSGYPSINFNTLFSCDAPANCITPTRFNKLACLFHYFARVTSVLPEGVITFERKVLISPPSWEKSEALFTNIHVDSKGTIERNGQGMIQVDFANEYVGGGVLGQGCVQEEIRFLVCPELIIARLFTEKLDSNEVLEVVGAETYSNYRGYASSFEWTGNFKDCTPSDSWGRRQVTVVAMDALNFKAKSTQFKTGMLRREVNKAYCGFMCDGQCEHKLMAVATGNWGCGVFGGDPRLKCVLQLLAAAEARRDVVYFTFGNRKLQKDICIFHSNLLLYGCTVGDVWKLLLKFTPTQDVFSYIEGALKNLSAEPQPSSSSHF